MGKQIELLGAKQYEANEITASHLNNGLRLFHFIWISYTKSIL